LLIVSFLYFPKFHNVGFDIKNSTAKSCCILIHFVFIITDEFCITKQNRKEKVSWDLGKKRTLQCNIMYAVMTFVKANTWNTYTTERRSRKYCNDFVSTVQGWNN